MRSLADSSSRIRWNTLASIILGLRQVGTFRSVPTLLKIVADPNMDENERALGVLALGTIGDPSVVGMLIDLAKTIDTYANVSKESEILRSDIFCALTNIGDPRAIPYLEEWLKKEQLSGNGLDFYRKQIDYLKQNQKHFVQDWILRWHFNNTNRNSKGLPYFPSKKKWANAGREIPGISQILFELYHDKEKRVSNGSILVAIGATGANPDITNLRDLILNDSIGWKENQTAFESILEIGGVQVLDEIISKIESHQFADSRSKDDIKTALINACLAKGFRDKVDSIRKTNDKPDSTPRGESF